MNKKDLKKKRRWNPSLKGTEYEQICIVRNRRREWYSKKQLTNGTKYNTSDFAQRLLYPNAVKPFEQ